MVVNGRRSILVVGSLLITFVGLRLYLHQFPGTNLDVAGYNIHHLFVGLLLITAGGMPLALCDGSGRWLNIAALLFGAGLSMALDEWVYLIATDGSDTSYLLPVSLWGGVAMIGLASFYALFIWAMSTRRGSGGDALSEGNRSEDSC